MDIEAQKIILDLRAFELLEINKDTGRERIRNLTAEGQISPRRTPTGRTYLSCHDVKRLAKSF